MNDSKKQFRSSRWQPTNNEPIFSTKNRQLLKSCQAVIEEMKDQLERAATINTEQAALIQMLTNENHFYAKQAKNNNNKEYAQTKDELRRQATLINELKKYNKELTAKKQDLEAANHDLMAANHELVDINQALKKEAEKTSRILNQQEHRISQAVTQKNALQQEWSQAIKVVRAKIISVQAQNQVANYQKMDKCLKNVHHADLQSEIQTVLKQIDLNLTESELRNIFGRRKPRARQESSQPSAITYATDLQDDIFR